jgi:hypothetical protein
VITRQVCNAGKPFDHVPEDELRDAEDKHEVAGPLFGHAGDQVAQSASSCPLANNQKKPIAAQTT